MEHLTSKIIAPNFFTSYFGVACLVVALVTPSLVGCTTSQDTPRKFNKMEPATPDFQSISDIERMPILSAVLYGVSLEEVVTADATFGYILLRDGTVYIRSLGQDHWEKLKISPRDLEKIDRLLISIEPEIIRVTRKSFVGPDSKYSVALVNIEGESYILRSWHPEWESDSRLAATSSGIEILQGASRSDVLKKDDLDYQKFREVWSEIESVGIEIAGEKGN